MTPLTVNTDFDHHEQVVMLNNPAKGLEGVIGIHSTALEPVRRANAEHRPPGDVADEVAKGLTGRGPRRAVNGATRGFA